MENEYPKIDKDIWSLKLFERAIIELNKNKAYYLMRVPGGWIYNDIVFIPFSFKKCRKNIDLHLQ